MSPPRSFLGSTSGLCAVHVHGTGLIILAMTCMTRLIMGMRRPHHAATGATRAHYVVRLETVSALSLKQAAASRRTHPNTATARVGRLATRTAFSDYQVGGGCCCLLLLSFAARPPV